MFEAGHEKGQLHSEVNIGVSKQRSSFLYLLCTINGLFPRATVFNSLLSVSFLATGTKHLGEVRLITGNSYHLRLIRGSRQPIDILINH